MNTNFNQVQRVVVFIYWDLFMVILHTNTAYDEWMTNDHYGELHLILAPIQHKCVGDAKLQNAKQIERNSHDAVTLTIAQQNLSIVA